MDLISTDWRDDAEDILPDLIALRRAILACFSRSVTSTWGSRCAA